MTSLLAYVAQVHTEIKDLREVTALHTEVTALHIEQLHTEVTALREECQTFHALHPAIAQSSQDPPGLSSNEALI